MQQAFISWANSPSCGKNIFDYVSLFPTCLNRKIFQLSTSYMGHCSVQFLVIMFSDGLSSMKVSLQSFGPQKKVPSPQRYPLILFMGQVAISPFPESLPLHLQHLTPLYLRMMLSLSKLSSLINRGATHKPCSILYTTSIAQNVNSQELEIAVLFLYALAQLYSANTEIGECEIKLLKVIKPVPSRPKSQSR